MDYDYLLGIVIWSLTKEKVRMPHWDMSLAYMVAHSYLSLGTQIEKLLFFLFFFFFFFIGSLLSTNVLGTRHVYCKLKTTEAINSGHKVPKGLISRK